jgi:pantetheine-phosphate adenylyltransferase
MAIIVYPGTFDPLTNGHVDLIQRASGLFRQVIVGVAAGQHKKTLFSLPQRLAFMQAVFKGQKNIVIYPLEGLLVDFVKTHQADVVLRGLRTAADFEYEFQLAGMNRRLNPECETIFMTPSEGTLFISSTLIRELIALKGDVSRFVPKVVAESLHHVA